MVFSEAWEDAYRANRSISVWPWSDLVSYVKRYVRPLTPGIKVLELGCGAGANIPFFINEGMDYYAVEGSETIVRELWRRFPDQKQHIAVGDFTAKIPFGGPFDLVVDRSSLTHNTTSDIRRTIGLIHDRLKYEGFFIGIDWFSTLHSGYTQGVMDEDSYTVSGFRTGQFRGYGRVHFSDKAHIEDLFSSFRIEVMEHKIIHTEIPATGMDYASWNFVARKVPR